jgi:hypothetical protein
MSESDRDRAKRELREAVRRVVEGAGMPAPRNPALHEPHARGAAAIDRADEKRRDA